MIRDQLAVSQSFQWQEVALMMFVAMFVAIAVYVFRRGKKNEYDTAKNMPLLADERLSDAEQRI